MSGVYHVAGESQWMTGEMSRKETVEVDGGGDGGWFLLKSLIKIL